MYKVNDAVKLPSGFAGYVCGVRWNKEEGLQYQIRGYFFFSRPIWINHSDVTPAETVSFFQLTFMIKRLFSI